LDRSEIAAARFFDDISPKVGKLIPKFRKAAGGVALRLRHFCRNPKVARQPALC
jgi:hypothetical protein